jgi:ethanolaminephosphotransferase
VDVQVTSIGLVFIALGFSVTAWYNPLLDDAEAVPRWAAAFAGVCLFVYQTMDNMDGKQARRVGASSALGFLFDHGCDAVNAGVLSPVMLATVLGAGGDRSGYMMALWLTTVVPFYLNTWEEFHTGEFVLQTVNGPDEGILFVVVVFLLTATFGPSIWWDWDQYAAKGLPGASALRGVLNVPVDAVLVVGLLSVPATVVMQIRQSLLHVTRQGTPPGADDGGLSVRMAALGRLVPLAVVATATSVAGFVVG